jgi:broad specificity phosphatase PhoE
VRWLLVRHGQTEWNRRGLIQGQADVPLNGRGRAQGRALGRALRGMPIRLALVSDLSRARATARLALAGRRVPWLVSPALREMDFGDWEGRRAALIRSPLGRTRREPGRRAPGGESFRDVVGRVRPVLAAAARRAGAGTILVVGHLGSLRAAVIALLGLPPSAGARFDFPGGGLMVVDTPNLVPPA